MGDQSSSPICASSQSKLQQKIKWDRINLCKTAIIYHTVFMRVLRKKKCSRECHDTYRWIVKLLTMTGMLRTAANWQILSIKISTAGACASKSSAL